MIPQKWTAGRLPIHMVLTTHPILPRPPKRRLLVPWRIVAWVALVPPVAALSVIAALALLRRGL